ncbi:uncharacterized protein LOC34622228 [Cyclospora cayetanensis]|uniref:Uncharacterized protein LOC34622228 n=1 Tax=Cyclospora cayetanensis TaxID=88456 RepID=A0A6P6S1M0_9EIME|nr:uncharacterized protein LOC34622228 [Cyclospora cayetanensis]
MHPTSRDSLQSSACDGEASSVAAVAASGVYPSEYTPQDLNGNKRATRVSVSLEDGVESTTSDEEDCLVDEATVRAGIRSLRAYRDAYAARGQYGDAQIAQSHIEELEAYLFAVVQERIRGKHLLQQAAVEHAHYEEIERLTTAWVRVHIHEHRRNTRSKRIYEPRESVRP